MELRWPFRRRGAYYETLLAMAAEGKCTEAQDRAVAAINATLPLRAKEAEAFLADLTRFIMLNGHFGLAERPWKALGPETSALARNTLIRFWRKNGCYEAENLASIELFLEIGVDEHSARQGLHVLHFMEAITPEHGPLLDRYFQRSVASGLRPARLLAVSAAEISLLRFGDDTFLRDLVQRKTFVDEIAGSLAMSRHVVDQNLPTTKAIEETADVARYLELCSETIWGDLGDTGKRLAVVGNSPKEKSLGKGAMIDAHDLVLRFNAGTVAPIHHADYGSRTDYAMSHFAKLPELEGHLGDLKGLILRDVEQLLPRQQIDQVAAIRDQGVPVTIVSSSTIAELGCALGAVPSSGIMMSYNLKRLRGTVDNLDFYGFGLIDQIGAKRNSANFAVQKTPSFQHNWVGEHKIFQQITDRAGEPRPTALTALPVCERPRCATERFQVIRTKVITAEGADRRVAQLGTAALSELARKHGRVVQDGDYDLLIVNGGGAPFDPGPDLQRTMETIARALDRGRKCILANTVWSDPGPQHGTLLRALDNVIVKDGISRDILAETHGISPLVVPELCLYEPMQSSFSALGRRRGLVGVSLSNHQAVLLEAAAAGHDMRPTHIAGAAMPFSRLVAIARKARVIVSPDPVAIYAAIRSRTPFVALPGPGHEIEGLIRAAGLPVSLAPAEQDLTEALGVAARNDPVYTGFFDWIARRGKWNLNLGPWPGGVLPTQGAARPT